MPRLIERKIHWRPSLFDDVAICNIIPTGLNITTGYLLGTLRKVTCKNCLKQMRKDPNITATMWAVMCKDAMTELKEILSDTKHSRSQ